MFRAFLTLLILTPAVLLGQTNPVRQVTDADVLGDVVWSADTTYVLNGFVFVDSLSSLTIEAGTVIKGKPGTGANASALIVARGGKIYANGSRTNPIIFTAEADDVDDPNDIPLGTRGLWGGVIILGEAVINVAGGQENIEGIPVTEPRGLYGGSNDDDSSGVFRFASIRHGGSDIGANNEINGLTMGGVGRKTVIEYVEVIYNKDDGFEWFGGTVNTRYLVSAFNGDDNFDYDEGFRGKGQFWFAIQGSDDAGSGGEHDGGTTPEDGMPYAIPVMYNVTYIGSGATSGLASNDFGVNFRDNAGGKYYNSLWTDFFGIGVQIEDLASGEDSYARLQAGDLELQNSMFWLFGGGTTPAELFVAGVTTATSPQIAAYVTDPANQNRWDVNPQLRGISRTNDGGLDPRPATGSPALSGAATPPDDGFFTQTDYIGAFKNQNWAVDWTFLEEAGILTSAGGGETVTDVQEVAAATEIPTVYSLEQNYPNPFNPSTTIRFSIPAQDFVTLKIYNVLGQEVATLVSAELAPGTYETRFDASTLSSGLYIYRLQTNSFSQTQKMVLVK